MKIPLYKLFLIQAAYAIPLAASGRRGPEGIVSGLIVGTGLSGLILLIRRNTDNKNGTYTATFTAGTQAGSDTITATIGGKPVTSTPATVTVTLSAARSLPTSSLVAAAANPPAIDAALWAMLLDDSPTTGKSRSLLES
jgi:hypothetical protein